MIYVFAIIVAIVLALLANSIAKDYVKQINNHTTKEADRIIQAMVDIEIEKAKIQQENYEKIFNNGGNY